MIFFVETFVFIPLYVKRRSLWFFRDQGKQAAVPPFDQDLAFLLPRLNKLFAGLRCFLITSLFHTLTSR